MENLGGLVDGQAGPSMGRCMGGAWVYGGWGVPKWCVILRVTPFNAGELKV